MTDTAQRVFVSYAGLDQAWAEWVGWQLIQAGHHVELDRWSWQTGDDFVQKMNAALGEADAVVALFSKNYFAPKRWTHEEWTANFAVRGRLVPVVIEPLTDDDIPVILAGKLRKDLHGLDETSAAAALLEAVHGPVTPAGPYAFPGGAAAAPDATKDPGRPRLPTSVGLPEVWNVRRRNPDFSGREDALEQLRTGLVSGHQAVIQALHGMGGIGKTQVAVEYAHRFASQYDLVWWIDAEQANQLPVRYTEFADRLGIAKPDAGTEANARALLQHLRTRHRWLLILDNAEQPDLIAPWLPEGPGHVLITSRDPDWSGIAHHSNLDVFTRDDSVTYLRTRSPGMTAEQAGHLAGELGDLPLALAQAAGVLRSGMSLDRYEQILSASTDRIMAEGSLRDYPVPLAATVRIALARLADENGPAAIALLHLAAFLGPEPIPFAWLETARTRLTTIAGDPDDPMWLRDALQHLGRLGLVRTDFDTFQVHRLTQAIVRAQASAHLAAAARADATTVLASVDLGDPESPTDWPTWAGFTAHLSARHISSEVTGQAELRKTLLRAVYFLLCSGQPRAAQDLGMALHEAWSADAGPDDVDVLTCAEHLGHASASLGDYPKARSTIEDTLARRRRVLGEDHPDTLQSANNLANTLWSLGEQAKAREMLADALARRRRVLGEDHPATLQSASNFAGTLEDLGQFAEARRMQEDILAHQVRVLGEEHPGTLIAASNLASTLGSQGEHEEARRMQVDVLARRARVLGEDHPDTIQSANNLASTLGYLGEHEAARRMKKDVLARHVRVLGEDHPHTLSAANNLAGTLGSQGEHEEARRMQVDVLARRARVLGEDHPHTLTAVGNLASTLGYLGEHGAARRMQEDALARSARVLGVDHPDSLIAASNLASTLGSQGEHEAARRMQEDALARRRRVLGVDHPDTLALVSNLASTLFSLRRHSEAIELLKDVRVRAVRVLGAKHPDALRYTKNLAAVLNAAGRTYEAQQLIGRKPGTGSRRSGRRRR
ncbi:FxSxx-COOH system tetratricopeptide repeat protein [Streptomyces sp. NPDC048202]|uniref:FxSxx-COOH system tetratricopeptide repeat protein n=1 Tax=Streptomyces sp. NPDC048202 TaxID=3365514 RepID=UPI00371C79BE